jgi:hypothetical protein
MGNTKNNASHKEQVLRCIESMLLCVDTSILLSHYLANTTVFEWHMVEGECWS